MFDINLLKYLKSLKVKKIKQSKYIFDIIRKKYIKLTPEESVRQSFIQFLIKEKNYKKSLFRVEIQLEINKKILRPDIVIYDKFGKAVMVVECKAPNINIDSNAIEQIKRYNLILKVKNLIIVNGLKCIVLKYDNHCNDFITRNEIPDYSELMNC